MDQEKATQGKSQPPSDKYIEHLRAVHFSLVILSCALLSAWLLSREGETKRALHQLESVKAVIDGWQTNWLNVFAENIIKQNQNRIPAPKQTEFWVPAGAHYPRLHIKLSGPFWTLRSVPPPLQEFVPSPGQTCSNAGKDFKAPVVADPLASVSICRPDDLASFEKEWNALSASLHIYHTHATTYWSRVSFTPLKQTKADSADSTVDVQMEDKNSQATAREVTLAFTALAPDSVKEFNQGIDENFTHIFYGWWFPSEESVKGAQPVMLPAFIGEIESEQFSGQSALTHYYQVQWSAGTFENTFPELNKVTKDIKDISLDRLMTIVRAEAERSDEKFEILGAKFPTEEIARWGSVAILLIQLYLFINLNALLSRQNFNSAEIDVPWIATYRGFIARTTTVISAAIFPTTVVAVLVIYHARLLGERRAWVLAGAAILFSAMLLLVLIRALNKLGNQSSA